MRAREPIIETDIFESEELDALVDVAREKKPRRAEAAGKIQIEIVQSLDGQNICSDFSSDHGPGLHPFQLVLEMRC